MPTRQGTAIAGAFLALAAGLAVAGPGVPTAQAAGAEAAVSCSGHGCDYKDPKATGCDAGAVTVHSISTRFGRVDLRWSGTCQTNWVRVNTTQSLRRLEMDIIEGYHGHEADFVLSPDPAGTHWGNMVYAPGCATGFVLMTLYSGDGVYEDFGTGDC